MLYRLIERANPQKREDPKKWYASSIHTGSVTVKSFAKEIAGRSSLTRGDIENVLANFLDELPLFLTSGMSIKLGEFGTLRLSISSEGTDTKEEFDASNIKGVKVIFTPSADLKKALEEIKFEEGR
jgi:predicted histone-like DNA-binding protein